jgi:hypothetical protein
MNEGPRDQAERVLTKHGHETSEKEVINGRKREVKGERPSRAGADWKKVIKR